MKVLLTGAGGQVGQELQRTRPATVDLSALSKGELDITSEEMVLETVCSLEPELVINAAAYTAVDQAEADRDSAFAVNTTGALHVALAARATGCRLIHLSTDFVFDGRGARPYRPDDSPHPLSVYGRSKLDGEEEIWSVRSDAAVIVRSSWIYSRFGSNFVKTMLEFMGSRPKLGVVNDQVGSPTWARGLAAMVWEVVFRPEITGIMHWADTGIVSWYDFALTIQDLALEMGLLEERIPVLPIATEDYPTPAPRPPFSVLDTTASTALLETPQLNWRVSLQQMLEEVAAEKNA